MNLFDISGKKAIVTGGAGDLGTSMVEGLLENGSEVIILDNSPRLSEVVDGFKARGFKVHGISANLADREGLEKSFEKAMTIFGEQLDILVNAAGIQRRYKSEEFPPEEWDLVININMTASFRLCQLAGKVMLKQGSGKIINVASMLSFFGGFTVPAYAASKGGVAQFTKALCNEWADKGININAIAPGYMDTQMNVNIINDPTRNDEISKRIPAKRWGTGQDMKGVVIFLASQASDYLNGAVIPVDGGYLVR
ncbi:MAG: dehydrogenase, short-chain alcohol dehydrogenase like protein [Clostridia bacterium]|nr:dehydrogenase, short-chain alcohol dehydrogenase like protein [Clostridia bacterium]